MPVAGAIRTRNRFDADFDMGVVGKTGILLNTDAGVSASGDHTLTADIVRHI